MPSSQTDDPMIRLNIAMARTLTEWVSFTIRHGWNVEPVVHDGTLPDILAKSQVGKFTCGTASRLLILAAEDLGFRAREILLIRAGAENMDTTSPYFAMNRHRVIEIDCLQRGGLRQVGRSQWILFDPTLNACFFDRNRREYATALTLHEAYVTQDWSSIDMVQGQPPSLPIGPAYSRHDGSQDWRIVLSIEEVNEIYNRLFTLDGCLAYYAHVFYLPSISWSGLPIEYIGAGQQPLSCHHGQSIEHLLGSNYHAVTSADVIYH